MVEMQLAHEGSVGPDAAISPQGVDRMGCRRRRALWGAVGVVIVLTLLLGLGGWLWWTGRAPPALLYPRRWEGVMISLDGSIPAPETKVGRLETGGMRSEGHQWIGSVRWTPREGIRPSMRCTWVRASTSTAWAQSPSLLSTHRP